MNVTTGLFYIFSTVLLIAAFRVITARNPVHAVLFLVLTFFQGAMVWMLLKAEFLSIVLVLVYVGAVMVLFLFVVMMMDINVENLRHGFWKHFPFAALVGVVIALEMAAVLMGGFRGTEVVAGAPGIAVSNTRELGTVLFTQYVYPLEVAAAILLVAMFAAIALTLRARKDSKHVSPGIQVRAKAKDRMTVLKMAATQPAVEPAPEAAPEAKQ
ncbi:MAG: NADH-quinone oxidoreductase subunit J [Rhodoferax sp.]|nr:NADH-quinone oxidoreductase subunit J [Rhodoferax sp.]